MSIHKVYSYIINHKQSLLIHTMQLSYRLCSLSRCLSLSTPLSLCCSPRCSLSRLSPLRLLDAVLRKKSSTSRSYWKLIIMTFNMWNAVHSWLCTSTNNFVLLGVVRKYQRGGAKVESEVTPQTTFYLSILVFNILRVSNLVAWKTCKIVHRQIVNTRCKTNNRNFNV